MRIVIAGMALIALAAVLVGVAPVEPEEDVRCHGARATIVGSEGDDLLRGTPDRDVIWGAGGDDTIHGGLGNDLADGGTGDRDRVIGDLGDDKLIGGPGDYDEVAGSLGIDTVSGGPGDFDYVHGDYGYDRMDGGPGSHDMASFATDVGAGVAGGGVEVSLSRHRARGDGHDRLFRFEDLEGSAFADTLAGDARANLIEGGAGNDAIRGGGGADALDGGQGSDSCAAASTRASCGREPKLGASAYVELDAAPGGGGGLQVVGGGGGDHFVVSFDEASSTFGVTATKGIALGPGCERVGATQANCPAEGPARWLTADLGPGADS